MALTMVLTTPLTGKGIRPLRMFGDHDLKVAFVNVTFDTSYPSGGYNFDPTTVTYTGAFSGVGTKMFNRVLGAFSTFAMSAGALGVVEASALVSAVYSVSTSKLMAINASAGTEWLNGKNLSAYTVTLMIVGT